MATPRKTKNLLPQIFQTDVNEKFLSATLDQLVSEPNLKKVYGYIGRQFSPTYKSADNYVQEINQSRQTYQLEPSTIVKDGEGKIKFFSSYTDLLNRVQYYGGLVNNHSRLFENESYTYDPQIDMDKFVNFSQYYWLPNGPDAVDIYSGNVELEKTYTVTRDQASGEYRFTTAGDQNPDVILARGGTYQFEVDQAGVPFWIQSEPGVDGRLNTALTISNRDVLGVENNGEDQGTVTFRVAQADEQDRWISMTTPYDAVNFTSSARYTDVHGQLVSQFIENEGGFDGIISELDGKTMIFVDQDQIPNIQTDLTVDPNIDEEAWTVKGPFYTAEYDGHWEVDPDEVWDKAQFLPGQTVPEADRVAVWTVKLVPMSNILKFNGNITCQAGDRIVQEKTGASAVALEAVTNSTEVKVKYENDILFEVDNSKVVRIDNITQPVYPVSTPNNDYMIRLDNRDPATGAVRRFNVDEKVYVKQGKTNANREFYKDYNLVMYPVPLITAPQDILYYQDGVESAFGKFKIVEPTGFNIDVNEDILGRKNYTSPNGVRFTNGLKVKFDVNVVQEAYRNNEYYVEGVGTAIKLVPVEWMVTPENYNSEISANYPNDVIQDYILINRGSVDFNPWSRNNRWFHADVIKATTDYNTPGSAPQYDQDARAVRPIIEFDADLQLFNHGRIGKKQIDILDTTTTDAFNSFQGQNITEAYGITLTSGLRIIFANDLDPLVKNKIYVLNIIYPEWDGLNADKGTPQINLVKADDGDIEEWDTTVVMTGPYKGSSWWYNGVNWKESQQKTKLHQEPLFDLFDANDISVSTYLRSDFVGNKIFGYKQGTGKEDTVLGFPLSYRNLTTQGEIEFYNFFDYDTFTYGVDATTVTESTSKYYLHHIQDRNTVTTKNIWNNIVESTKQYQTATFSYDGESAKTFTLETAPALDRLIPNTKVYVNNKFLAPEHWTLTDKTVTVTSTLAENDKVDICYFSTTPGATLSYQVPVNLDFNAQNKDLTSLTLGQLRNHLSTLSENTRNVVGPSVGANNLRDLNFKSQGGQILQHSAPVSYASLFLTDEDANFVKALKHAQREYQRFRNKFLELSVSLNGVDGDDPERAVDLIMQELTANKNNTMSWYHSDMVPFGDNKRTINYEIFNPLDRRYEITNVFNDSQLADKGVLVYLNADPDAKRVNDATVDVDADIINSANYISPEGVLFENNMLVRFGNSVNPPMYRNKTYRVGGVGSAIALTNANNNVQLVKDRDYVFDDTLSAITLTDRVTLEVGYNLKIVEYNDTHGSYVPETPTKLGLWPKYYPEQFEDTSYRTTINVIRGHDGSRTPAFGDFRDTLLLELEKRIYNNIKVDVNNEVFKPADVQPGKFRTTDYTRKEFDQLLSTSFLTWVGNNSIDYSSNTTFQANDPFTWNYGRFSDAQDREKLPGGWRGVYNYYYDTDAPNRTPWESLGFANKPSWWEDRYGPAPYTGGNALLWEDLQEGRVWNPTTQTYTVVERYKRPGLVDHYIPCDENGYLKAPAQYMVYKFNSLDGATAWALGDQGPAETAWRRSSDYPFAVQMAMALAKPARYFGQLINVQQYYKNATVNQYIDKDTSEHLKQSDITYHAVGNKIEPGHKFGAGYLNWIGDYLINLGITPKVKFDTLIKEFDINLAYKMAGFTDKRYLTVLAEQYSPTSTNDSVVLPQENYRIHLAKSTPVKKVIYSGVIITKTNNGWSVKGYNTDLPYFTIIPSVVNNNATKIKVLDLDATIYFDYKKEKITVPYGYEFKNRQQVVDFLISYERSLKAQGFVFNDLENELGEIKNFTLSAKEFLNWIQQGWAVGNILILSPVNNSIRLLTSNAIVDGITDTTLGSKVLDQNFRVVKKNNYQVVRFPDRFKVTLDQEGQTIGLVELNLVQYEHVLSFDNETVFNDVIYKPELGNRQYRLKLIGQVTADWDGSLSPGGFIYNDGEVDQWSQGRDYLKGELVEFKDQYYVALENITATSNFDFSQWEFINREQIKSGLLPNFSTIAKFGEAYYNTYDESLEPISHASGPDSNYDSGLIGFKDRPYLDELGLSEATQVDLYKGYIKQKGTRNAVNALLKTEFNNISSEIDYYEEWAIRTGEYGSIQINPYTEVALDEKTYSTNPQYLEYTSLDSGTGTQQFGKGDLYKSEGEYSGNIALTRGAVSNVVNDIKTAGFVNVDDVDATIFDINNFTELNTIVDEIGTGYTIWCAKDFDQDWNVYRVSETNNAVTQIENALDGYITMTCEEPHEFVLDQVILLKNFSTDFDGFYKVQKIVSGSKFNVEWAGEINNLTVTSGRGLLFELDSLRFPFMEDVRTFVPRNEWRVGEKVWIDSVMPAGEWGVFEKKKPYSFTQRLQKSESEFSANIGFGHSVKMNDNGTIISVGNPDNQKQSGFEDIQGDGSINTFIVDNISGNFVQSFNYRPLSNTTAKFGQSVDVLENTMVVGAPESETDRGHVYIYTKQPEETIFQNTQVLRGTSGDNFGNTVAFSRDGLWLYVCAPGGGNVYAYGYDDTVSTQSDVITIGPSISPSGNVTLSFTPDSAEMISVQNGIRTYVAGQDYTVTGNVITFVTSRLPSYNIDTAVRQVPGYKLVDTITAPVAGEEFGSAISVSAEGAQVGIGAPAANVTVGSTTYTEAGKVYVYDRTIESFKATGNLVFTTTNPLQEVIRVLIDGNVIEATEYAWSTGGTTVTFNLPPDIGSVVTVESNKFNLLQDLTGTRPQDGSRHGTSLTICSFNCAIYVGAPGFDVITGQQNEPANAAVIPSRELGTIYHSGAVFKNHNQGRLYGTIAGKAQPTVTAGHSIRLNDFEVTFSGTSLSSVVTDINDAEVLGVTAVIEGYVDEKYYEKINSGWYNTTTDELVLNSENYLIDSTTVSGANLIVALDSIYHNHYTKYGSEWRDNEGNVAVTSTAAIALLDQDQHLRLNSDITVARNRLRVLSGQGTALSDLGLDVFVQMQIMTSPYFTSGERFGTKVVLNKEAHGLLISSEHGTTREQTLTDNGTTTFDDDSTLFKRDIGKSGSTYLFELYDDPRDSLELPGRYSFTQQFNPGDLNVNDQFGYATDIIGKYVIVTAPNDDTDVVDGGSIYIFENPNGEYGWTQVGAQETKVDLDTVSRIFLYDKQSNNILTNLETLDPSKGKVLGVAESEIDYKTEYDPAVYNRGTNANTVINEKLHWNGNHEHQVWWNLGKVRYIDYEQGDLEYRTNNWARQFPGSTIQVCEWVGSSYLPSEYIANGGNGVPLYEDDSAYVELTIVDQTTGIISSKYYYWVYDKTEVTDINGIRQLPVTSIAELIDNPKAQDIPYAAIIKSNAIALFNVGSYLSGTDTILHVDHEHISNDKIIHSEYELIENSPNAVLPTKIRNKMIDSLSGIDRDGRVVPDPTLSVANKYGISIRPRQSVVKNRFAALDQVVSFINTEFAKLQLVDVLDFTSLNKQEPMPTQTSGQWNLKVSTVEELSYLDVETYAVGYTVLVEQDTDNGGLWVIYEKTLDNTWIVKKVQSYKTSEYWSYSDWYATGYSNDTAPKFIVESTNAARKLSYAVNDIIKVNNDGNGKWRLLKVDSDHKFVTVGREDGTIQISTSISDLENNRLGFGNQGFEEDRFDQNPSTESRFILEGINDNLTSGVLSTLTDVNINDVIFIVLKYVFTEQPYVDWLFKTSFVSVLHKLRALTQPANYVRDNQTYYESYIEEVKPYKTKLREYVLDYTKTDTYEGSVTDFDLPAYYDRNLKVFRSPSGEVTYDGELLANNAEYRDWYDNKNYEINSITVTNPGSGYTEIPEITITNPGGTGANARARATLDFDTGTITAITVTNPGSGYNRNVVVTINGNGTGATARADLINNQVRGIKSYMTFDRITFNTTVPDWKANTKYTVGDVVTYSGQAYNFTANMTSTSTFDFTNVAVTGSNVFTNSNDRISSYYDPTKDMAQIEITEANVVVANTTTNSTRIYVDGLQTRVKDLHRGMFISGGEANNTVITGVVSNVATNTYYVTTERPQTFSANTVVQATYKNVGQLINGINYPGVQVTGADFDQVPGFDGSGDFGRYYDQVEYDEDGTPILSSQLLDTIIRSNYTDASLGTSPEDINVDGGAYVDRYSSHAPEELVPGITFDTLDMKVYTNVAAHSGNVIAYRVFNNMLNSQTYYRIGAGATTTLSANLGINDTTVSVTDPSKLSQPDRETATPGVIFVDNERIVYYRNYALETTPWMANVAYPADTVLTHGNVITLSSAITANVGDHITQASANAVVTANTTTSTVQVSYLTGTFTLGSGNVSINGTGAGTHPTASDPGYYKTTANMSASTTFDYTITSVIPDINILDQIRRGTQGTPVANVHSSVSGDSEYNNGAISNVTGNGSDFFKREVTVNGVRIMAAGTVGGQTAVPDAFTEKVARMFELFTDPNGSDINEEYQRNLIKTLSGDAGTYHEGFPTLQRVARGAGSDYSTNFLTDAGILHWNLTALFDTTVQNDMVWYLNSTGSGYGDGEIDAQEVIEHVFHTLHMHGLPGDDLKMYPEYSPDWATSDLYNAMVEAFDGGYWDSSGYGGADFKTDPDAYAVAVKEYLYLLNFCMFDYSDLWDSDSLAPEWSDSVKTPAGIQSLLPLGYALYNTYIKPVISKPSLATIRSIFKDGNTPSQDNPALAGLSGYVPSGVKIQDASELNQIIVTPGNVNVYTGNVFTSATKPAYELRVEGNVTANVGDSITQTISGANVFVLNNVVESNVVFVTQNLTTAFTFSNLVPSTYGLNVNGTLQANAYPQSMTLAGKVDSNGNVTISANATLTTEQIFNTVGSGTATNGLGLGSSGAGSGTTVESFLWQDKYQ